VSTALFLLTLELETIVGNSFSFRLPPFPPREGATELQTMRRSRPSVHAESPAVVEGSKHEPDYSRLTLWAPLKTVLFRDGGVSRVLKSSCIRPYTPVFRARLPCPHKKTGFLEVPISKNHSSGSSLSHILDSRPVCTVT
jgi:hypothetical protein